MEHDHTGKFMPWAVIISSLIILIGLIVVNSSINGVKTSVSDLKDSVEKLQLSTSATASAQPTAQAAAEKPDLSFINDPKLYPSVGPESAEVTVYEFSDFQCPYCAMSSGLPEFTKQLPAQYAELIGTAQKVQKLAESGKIKFVYVNLGFLGAESVTAAQGALCAHDQGKFWEMHDAIFTAHDGKENNGKYAADKIKEMAKKITGIDSAKFNTCMDSKKYEATVQQMTQTAFQSSKIQGTPAFIISYKGENTLSSGAWSEITGKLKAAGVEAN